MKRRSLSTFAALAVLLLSPASGHALDEAIGRALFRRAWVPAPSSTKANDGLGPLFNARSCTACHQDLDRKRVETDAHGIVQSDHLVMRFSDFAGHPDPVYGRQMQTSAVSGPMPEGRVAIRGHDFQPAALAYGPLASETRTGMLLAPSLRGLGALETVPDAAIVALADKGGDRRGGVKGRVNWITDQQGQRHVGKFGWKASLPSLDAQVENAFLLDLGLSTEGRPAAQGDCTPTQQVCLSAPQGGQNGSPEISAEIVSRIAAYLASIEPVAPAQRDPHGEKLFEATGCAACHRPALPGKAGVVRAFTDLLVHDMGPELDGGATEPGVSPTEWRTAPLWGLSRTLANEAGLLHDGRAKTVEEAVGFHGGEAALSRTRFKSLKEAERHQLVEFLKSL